MEQIIDDHIRCPITRMIYMQPVVAGDGHVYEKEAILKWVLENNTSPMTTINISSKVMECIKIKKFVTDYLELHPEKKEEQYTLDEDVKPTNDLLGDPIIPRRLIIDINLSTPFRFTTFIIILILIYIVAVFVNYFGIC